MEGAVRSGRAAARAVLAGFPALSATLERSGSFRVERSAGPSVSQTSEEVA
jgi:hypothetical protein